jgi:hypothetical protein
MMNPKINILEMSNLRSESMSLVSKYKLNDLDATISELGKNSHVEGVIFIELFGLFVQKDVKFHRVL